MRSHLSLAVLLLLPLSAYSQSRISGIVTDSRGEGLPFVHIVVNEQKDRVFTSEVSGEFSIPYAADVRSLTFSYVGFAHKQVEIGAPPSKLLRVVLEQEPYYLQEAVVIAGENPAHRIIRLALKNRDRHNPEKLNGYKYRAFTKMTLRMLPNRDAQARREALRQRAPNAQSIEDAGAPALSRFDTMHLFVMETLSEHAFQKPQKKREEVLRHRTSGFQEPWFVGIVSQLQPFAFYRDELPFLEKRYLNPISQGSTARYRFRLEDTFLDGPDSIFVISFQPIPNTAFTGLKGALYIHSDGYAIQHLIAESAEEEQIRFHIDQKYSRGQGGQWFPEQLSLVLDAEKYPDPATGMRMSSRTYLDSVFIDPEFPRGFFASKAAYHKAEDINRQDSVLALARRETITYTDSITYAFLDSIGTKANLDDKIRLLETVAEGAVPLGKIDWMFSDLLRFSTFEGFTPGLGLRTGRRLSKWVQLYGYGAYAFRAKQWKYGGTLSVFPAPGDRSLSFSLQYRNDLLEPATFDFPIQNALVNRRYFAQRMDRQEMWGAFFSAQPLRSLSLRMALQQQRYTPLYAYRYLPPGEGTPLAEFAFTEAEIFLRYAYRARSFRFLGTDTEIQSDYPVVYLKAAKGWNGLWAGQFDYWHLHGAVQYTLRHRRWGATNFTLEGGWSTPDVPYPKLFTPIGTGAGIDAISLNAAFETMQPYEFISNRSAHVYIEHTFQRLTKRSKVFQPRPALIHRMGWGDLANASAHELEGFGTMKEGYFESGLALHSILRLNYLNIAYVDAGIKALYRYGPYQLPEFKDNVAVRLTLQFSR